MVEDSNSVSILPSIMCEATYIVCLTAIADTCMYNREQIANTILYTQSIVISTLTDHITHVGTEVARLSFLPHKVMTLAPPVTLQQDVRDVDGG